VRPSCSGATTNWGKKYKDTRRMGKKEWLTESEQFMFAPRLRHSRTFETSPLSAASRRACERHNSELRR
jgi:hypothetical protein